MSGKRQKARRLLDAGMVEPLNADGLMMATVVGDSGAPYRVVVGPTLSGMCQCKYWRETMLPCSHIETLVELSHAPRADVEQWMLATAKRKTADAKRGGEIIDSLQ